MIQSQTSRRTAIGALALSAATIVGIAVNEGYSDKAIIPVKNDVATIGFGETRGVKIGDKTTPVRALVTLLKSADKVSQGVKKCAPVPMYQYEFSAYVDFAYNLGVPTFCKSSIVKHLLAGDYASACKAILPFDKFHGKRLSDLTTRRQSEYKQCMGVS